MIQARWTRNLGSLESDGMQRTVIARWWPSTYYVVSTIEVHIASSEDLLATLIKKIPGADIRDKWVTQIFRCDRYGLSNRDHALYSQECTDLVQAKLSHETVVHFLETGGNPEALSFTADEIMRVSWLRAVEWLKWPSFVLQPLLPILYFSVPWRLVLAAVVLANVVWLFVRYRFVSYTLATLGCLFVRLKWPTMLLRELAASPPSPAF